MILFLLVATEVQTEEWRMNSDEIESPVLHALSATGRILPRGYVYLDRHDHLPLVLINYWRKSPMRKIYIYCGYASPRLGEQPSAVGWHRRPSSFHTTQIESRLMLTV
mmetsp:Transcript_13845/g.22266  ORF Transcript_13845/g.22266 Transcript_13845/m.22266 type:complete len:108 (+) Transcript_13845:2031-2354(+)